MNIARQLKIAFTFSLLVSGSLIFAQQTKRFSRTQMQIDECLQKFRARLNIQFGAEAERVCANYTDENLNCAAGIMLDYRVTDHQDAIKVCLLKFRSGGATLNRCTLDAMGRAVREGLAPNISEIISRCERGDVQPRTVTPPPTYESRPSQPYVPPPAPIRRESNRQLLGKVGYDQFAQSVARWLKIPVTAIESIQTSEYFIINSLFEKIAVSLGREVQLHNVEIDIGPKKVKCVGTDFDPNASVDRDQRVFTLHQCKIHDSQADFNAQFRNLDYDFLEKISPDFKLKMVKYGKQKGPGNINFDRASSEFLVIPY